MKKLVALMLICIMALPAGALAQQGAGAEIRFVYNGQAYDCTFNNYRKCCGEADTRYDVWLNPAGSEEIGSVNLAFPYAARTGDKYLLHPGETHEWITFYVTDGTKARHYVSAPGSLFGTGLVAEGDCYELTVNSLEHVNGVAHADVSVRASFMNGEMNFEIDFVLPLV